MNISLISKFHSNLLPLLLIFFLVACHEPSGQPPSSPPIPEKWPDGTPIATDYPRDHYGVPYAIGNLGGQPVNLPVYSMDFFVEYEDSPRFDREKLKNYKPPVRTYDDVIIAFAFYLNHSTGVVFDSWHPKYHEWRKERETPGNPWVRVGVRSGSSYPKDKNIYDVLLEKDLNQGTYPSHIPLDIYAKTDETMFGLEVYANPGVNPNDGIAWRHSWGSNDLFIHRDNSGHVISYIKCSNNPVPLPPCSHRFLIRGNDMKAELSLLYNRQNLPHWQKIEAQAEKAVRAFIVKPAVSN